MTQQPHPTYAALGGEAWLRPIIERLVERMYADPMIGFFFDGISAKRIVALEFSHAAAHLGHDAPYRGRPLGRAHAKHRIGQGHFNRRLQILREVLAEAHVPEGVQRGWLEAQARERPAIVASGAGAPCPTPHRGPRGP